MRRLLLSLLVFSAVIGLMPGCASENLEDLADNEIVPCDTTVAPTYSGYIRPLLNNNCIECHNSTRQRGNRVLETYTQVKTAATEGLLVGVTSRLPGFKKMPGGTDEQRPQLPKCDLLKIKQWVRAGALNN